MINIPLHTLKKDLNQLPPDQVVDICLRLVRLNKENRELLTYLIFFQHNEQAFIDNVKKEIRSVLMDNFRVSHAAAKQNYLKAAKLMNKYLAFSKEKKTEVEIRIHFCKMVKRYSGFVNWDDQRMVNRHQKQLEKIGKVIAQLHEDLQHDYIQEVKELM